MQEVDILKVIEFNILKEYVKVTCISHNSRQLRYITS